MGGLGQKGNVIFVDPEVAKLEGVDAQKLVAFYAEENIRIVLDRPYFLQGEDRWVCGGCKRAWERNNETWRPSEMDESGWQPLCRECEGTTLSQHHGSIESRKRYAKQNEGRVRKKPGLPARNPGANSGSTNAAPGKGRRPQFSWER